MSDIRSVQVRISGRVQGVGYRAWTERQAHSLQLSGWVRNVAGGDVEAAFSGPPAVVEAMLEACYLGPTHARVTGVDITDLAEPIDGSFAVRYD